LPGQFRGNSGPTDALFDFPFTVTLTLDAPKPYACTGAPPFSFCIDAVTPDRAAA
jgi:hypothetical protein